jgi:ubiquitin-conjugating enzyme E2 O
MVVPAVRFEPDDTVLLRGDGAEPDLVGRVERTYHALDSHEPLEDCLIIAYVAVDTDIIRQFTSSGRPPKGYIFVEFAREEDGHALLPEESVSLISRALSIGDAVKQDANSSMFGTVIDVQSSYTLNPVFLQYFKLNAQQEVGVQDQMTARSTTSDILQSLRAGNLNPQKLSYEANGDDLRRAEDFRSGDYIISRDWFGLVEVSDTDVAVLLDNMTIVWVERPWELEIVVTNPRNKPLVSMPELDGIWRPDVIENRNGIVSMPSKRLGSGDKVVTNRRNLERGRWLVGQYDEDMTPQGVVLDVRTRRLDIGWLVPNAFADDAQGHMPPSGIRPYENLTSFRNPRDLRLRKDLTRYDHHRKPYSGDAVASSTPLVSAGDVYYPGDRVRFRSSRYEQVLQAPKMHKTENLHQGELGSSITNRVNDSPQLQNANSSGYGSIGTSQTPRPRLVPRSETFEFDLNEYTVSMGHHLAVVRWQDGTESTLESTQLTPYSLPESDLCPGDLVIAKEGLKMTGLDTAGKLVTSDFNEMSFFEQDHTLQPSKVGVIQSMDGQERLARVRWYADPYIKLSAYGQVLQEARFGNIGENIEDVSLYEIMTVPALIRKLGDLVVIPPGNPRQVAETYYNFAATPGDFYATHPSGPTTLSYLLQISSKILPALQEIARPFFATVSPRAPGVHKCDWIGEIVGLGIDGSVTVRLGGMKDCKDVVMTHENILLTVDENIEFVHPDEAMAIDSDAEEISGSPWKDSLDGSVTDEESAIDEIVEYEGGERLDNESGEDEWSTDEDTSESLAGARRSGKGIDLIEFQMGGTGQADGKEAHDSTGHQQEPQQAQATNSCEANGVMSSERTAKASTTEPTPILSVNNPEDPTQEAVRALHAQYLHQKYSPSSFEILDQVPSSDQYLQDQVPTENPTFLKRIAKEHRILASSLPAGEIYVRTYESRLDLLRCLIIGPADTPYEYCPFVIDLHLGSDYPSRPPKAHFHSWTSGLGRINPNLYEEGKICLSLLGTWPGQSKQEGWSEQATILQLLVSLQGLVFVSQPFYNEAGFETYGKDKVYSLESQQYSEKAYVMARGFTKYALLKAPSGLEDVLAWLYVCSSENGTDSQESPRLLLKVIQRAKLLMKRSAELKQRDSLQDSDKADSTVIGSTFLIDGVGNSSDNTKTFLKPLSQGASVMLKKIVTALEEIWQHNQEFKSNLEWAVEIM